MGNNLQVAGFLDNSTVNGQGIRSVIFLAGCNHDCAGCQNKSIQDYKCGDQMEIKQLLMKVLLNKEYINGVTLSGGEPFDQDFSKLAELFKKNNLNLWVYTGYTIEQLMSDTRPYIRETLKYIDVIVDGKFDISKTRNAPKYVGSTNQRFICMQNGEIIQVKNKFD